MAVKKDPKSLELAEPFVSLFPVDAATLKLVTDSIREHGYQIDKPILVWRDAFGQRGREVVVDGHTRLQAARDLRLREIWATVRQFKNTDAAITAGIGEQVQRRNLNREQIAAYVVSILPLLDETKGGLRTRTAKQLAGMLGVSVPTIDRARGIIASGDQELIDQVKTGRKSLLAAYTELTTGAPPSAPEETAPGEVPIGEAVDRWEHEHPEPRPEDYYSDESDYPSKAHYYLDQARYHMAELHRIQDRQVFVYRQIVKHADELVTDPWGSAVLARAATGIRFLTAQRKAEAFGSTPEEFAEAQLAWVAYVAAKDALAALNGEPHGDDRPVELDDFLYHPAFEEWRDEAEQDEADAAPSETDEQSADG
jgi:ParB-like chromosome segregation protein Spo0J